MRKTFILFDFHLERGLLAGRLFLICWKIWYLSAIFPNLILNLIGNSMYDLGDPCSYHLAFVYCIVNIFRFPAACRLSEWSLMWKYWFALRYCSDYQHYLLKVHNIAETAHLWGAFPPHTSKAHCHVWSLFNYQYYLVQFICCSSSLLSQQLVSFPRKMPNILLKYPSLIVV